MLPLLPSYNRIRKYYSTRMHGMVGAEGTALDRRNELLLAKWDMELNVHSAAWSPNSAQIAIGCAGHVDLLDAFSGQLLLDFPCGHEVKALSIGFSPDGTRVVSGSSDCGIRVWDINNGKLVLGPTEGHKDAVTSVVFSHDGTKIISGSTDKTVCVWDANSGDLVLGPLVGHTDSVTCVIISSNTARIISTSKDETILIWDAENGNLLLGPITGHTNWIVSIALSPDDARLVSGAWDHTLRIWDSRTGHMLQGPLVGHTDWVDAVSFSPDGSMIASGACDLTVRMWNAITGECTHSLLTHRFDNTTRAIISRDVLTTVSFSPDGTRIISSSMRGSICMIDAQITSASLGVLPGHTKSIRSIDISPDGTHLVSGSGDGSICIWDLTTNELTRGPLIGHTGRINSVRFSPSGSRIISGSGDRTVRQWDFRTGTEANTPIKHESWVTSAAYLADATRFASRTYGGDVFIWDSSGSERTLRVARGPGKTTDANEFSSDGTMLLIGSVDSVEGTVTVWDVQTERRVLHLQFWESPSREITYTSPLALMTKTFTSRTSEKQNESLAR